MEPSKLHGMFSPVMYAGTGVDRDSRPIPVGFKDELKLDASSAWTMTHMASSKDVDKLNHAIQCMLQVLSPKQKKAFVSLYMEKKDAS